MSTKKEPLKVGDRVVVRGFYCRYDTHRSYLGKWSRGIKVSLMTAPAEDGSVAFMFDGKEYQTHVSNCRRLKKKSPLRELWINEYFGGLNEQHYTSEIEADRMQLSTRIRCVHFREVRAKK